MTKKQFLSLVTCILVSSFPLHAEYEEFVLNCNNPIFNKRQEPRSFLIISCEDDSEWVVIMGNAKERFAGFLYLKNKITEIGLENIKAAKNKVLKYGDNFLLVSRYHGRDKPSIFKHLDKIHIINNELGFTDTAGGTNLRVKGDTIYIFDTELSSFKPELRENIMEMYGHIFDEVKEEILQRTK